MSLTINLLSYSRIFFIKYTDFKIIRVESLEMNTLYINGPKHKHDLLIDLSVSMFCRYTLNSLPEGHYNSTWWDCTYKWLFSNGTPCIFCIFRLIISYSSSDFFQHNPVPTKTLFHDFWCFSFLRFSFRWIFANIMAFNLLSIICTEIRKHITILSYQSFIISTFNWQISVVDENFLFSNIGLSRLSDFYLIFSVQGTNCKTLLFIK